MKILLKFMRRLTKHHKQVQSDIMYEAWETHKAELTMDELAFILRNLPKTTRTLYRVIKKRSAERNPNDAYT